MPWLPLCLVLWLTTLVCSAQPIDVAVFPGGEGREFYARAIADFEKATGYEVQLEADPAIADRLRLSLLEGRDPDLTNSDLPVWRLLEHQRLLPLDPWLDGPAWDGQTRWRDSFTPGSLEPYQKGGKTYGVPLVSVTWSLYYNKALFRRYGWDPPRTWGEMFRLAESMKAVGLAPMAFQGRYPYYAKPLVQSTFYHLAGAEAHQAQLALREGAFLHPDFVRALGLWRRWSREGLQPGAQGMSHTEAQMEFFAGRAAMLICGSWLYSEMRSSIPPDFELGAVPLPQPEGGRPETLGAQFSQPAGYWFVFAQGENPEGGVELLRYLTSTEVTSVLAREQGATVAVREGNRELHPAVADLRRQLAQLQTTFGDAPGRSLPGFDQVWTDTLSRLLADPHFQESQAALALEQGAKALKAQAQDPDRIAIRHPFKAAALLLFLTCGLVVAWPARGATYPFPQASAPRGVEVLGLTLPGLGVLGVFFLGPSAAALLAATWEWDGIGSPEAVGLRHFQRLLLESDAFWTALSNNLFLMVVPPLVVLPLSVLLAYALDQGIWGHRVFRVVFFLPYLMGVSGILLWQQIYHPAGGLLNSMLTLVGGSGWEGYPWLAPQNLYWALVPMAVWGSGGFFVLLFLAAMQGIPTELYEAAELDGATAWPILRYLTLPAIWPTVVASFLFMAIAAMKAFEVIWLMTQQAPTSDSHVIGTLLMRTMLVEQKLGQASALATLLFLVVFVASLLAQKALGKAS